MIGISKLAKSLLCVACKGKVEPGDGQLSTCRVWKVKQETAACRASWFCVVMVRIGSVENVCLGVFNSQFTKLVGLSELRSTLATDSADEVSESILVLGDVKITYDSVKNTLIDVDLV